MRAAALLVGGGTCMALLAHGLLLVLLPIVGRCTSRTKCPTGMPEGAPSVRVESFTSSLALASSHHRESVTLHTGTRMAFQHLRAGVRRQQ
jgi:hypothetical protein